MKNLLNTGRLKKNYIWSPSLPWKTYHKNLELLIGCKDSIILSLEVH